MRSPDKISACRIFGKELNISPEGYLSPCYALADSDYMRDNMPNIFKMPLKEAISDSEFTHCVGLKVSDIIDKNEKCIKCGYRKECGGGCRASALISGDGYFSCDPAMCMIFEKGYYERLRSAAQRGYAAYINKYSKEK